MKKLKYFSQRVYRKIKNTFLKKRLKNDNFTILAPTCIAGIMYHWLGEQFLSPTINMFFNEKDFLRFAKDIDYYINQEPEFLEMKTSDEGYSYPVGVLKKTGEEDIKLYFMHYKNFDEAKEKWNKRKKRVNKDNLFYIFSTQNGNLSLDDVKDLKSIKAKGIVCFTAEDYNDIDYCLQLKAFKNEQKLGKYLVEKRTKFLQKYSFEKDFDFVYWLNTGKVKK